MKKKFNRKTKKIKTNFIIKNSFVSITIGLIITIIIFIVIIGWGIYNLDWQGRFVQHVAALVPYPVAKVDNIFILYKDYFKTLNAAKTYYNQESTPDMSEAELKKFVLYDRLIKDILIIKIADSYNLKVSRQEINDRVDQIVLNKGSKEELVDFLYENYNLSLNEYIEYFIKPTLYFEKVNQAIELDENINGEAKQKIQNAYNDLLNGQDFELVVQKYSVGDLESIDIFKGQLDQDIEDLLWSLDAGQFTDILTVEDSFQILKIVAKNGDLGVITLDRIIVPIKTLDSILEEEKNKAKIEFFIK